VVRNIYTDPTLLDVAGPPWSAAGVALLPGRVGIGYVRKSTQKSPSLKGRFAELSFSVPMSSFPNSPA
jgi:hypothetical protein